MRTKIQTQRSPYVRVRRIVAANRRLSTYVPHFLTAGEKSNADRSVRFRDR